MVKNTQTSRSISYFKLKFIFASLVTYFDKNNSSKLFEYIFDQRTTKKSQLLVEKELFLLDFAYNSIFSPLFLFVLYL